MKFVCNQIYNINLYNYYKQFLYFLYFVVGLLIYLYLRKTERKEREKIINKIIIRQ
jgi:surface polysaccharide O-acyltransferase-like enzyme